MHRVLPVAGSPVRDLLALTSRPELVSTRLTGRGLPTEDVLITTGSQQALALVATALLEPGAVVAVEEPTYLAALQCFQLAGARVVPVASGENGMDPASLREVVERDRPALLYLVPTFANPTGRTLSAARRAEIAELVATHGLWIVEDDPYGELRYRGEPVPALASVSDQPSTWAASRRSARPACVLAG